MTEGKKIAIGNNCLFSSNVVFRTGDSHSIIDFANKKRINYGKDIVLEDHVWLTNGVTLLKGSYISENSVVATNSVVTKQFKTKNVILGGSPAKVLKENITWDNKRL